MIRSKKVMIADVEFTITFSDAGFRIRKVGTDEVYDDAVDVLEFEYEETDQKIEGEPDGI